MSLKAVLNVFSDAAQNKLLHHSCLAKYNRATKHIELLYYYGTFLDNYCIGTHGCQKLGKKTPLGLSQQKPTTDNG